MPGFQNDPGVTQQEAGFGFDGRFWTESFTDGLTALAGGGRSGATKLTSMFNRIATVVSIGDSVVLPPIGSKLGLSVCVINAAANAMQVFADGSDTINGTAGSSGLSQMGNSVVFYSTIGANTWIAQGLGTGFTSQYGTYSTQTGITANPGGGQASAVAITAMQAQVSVCATAGDSVRLPAALPGMEITVVNNGAQSCNVFAPSVGQGGGSGGDFMNGSQNGSAAVAAAAVTIFYCFVSGKWVSK